MANFINGAPPQGWALTNSEFLSAYDRQVSPFKKRTYWAKLKGSTFWWTLEPSEDRQAIVARRYTDKGKVKDERRIQASDVEVSEIRP